MRRQKRNNHVFTEHFVFPFFTLDLIPSSHVIVPSSHVAVPSSHDVVPSRHVNLGHINVQGTDQIIEEGATYSSSVSHSKASDEKHKHVHNDIVHLAAHHHDHTNLHEVKQDC